MKMTIIKTDKDGQQRLSRCDAAQLTDLLKTSRKELCCELYPGVDMRRKKDGTFGVRSVNGVVVLTVGHLSPEACPSVKQAAMTLPTTLAAMTAANGQEVKILVCYTPTSATMADLQAVAAYHQALTAYGQIAGHPITREEASTTMHFALPHDPLAMVNADAVALPLEQYGQETLRLIDFLNARFEFRYNSVMGYTEYHTRNSDRQEPWTAADSRAVNSMTMTARIAGMNAWDKDVRRYVESTMITPFNPIGDFLGRARQAWDGTTDHIGRLMQRVPCQQPMWTVWFRKWMLYMVAQWMGVTRHYGNATVPLLISRQGNNKSTFCRMLLPDELQWGYNDNLLVSEKKATLQAMSQMLLINLDEINQISPAIQAGFLKNIIQLPQVKLKRPFASHIEEFPRLASFIATTNMADILADPSGNRRFIAIELTGPIDMSTPIDHLGLYGQAVSLVEQGYQYWLTPEELNLLMEHNRQYQQLTPAEQWFGECYDIATDDSQGQWMTCAAIYSHLRRTVGSTFGGSLNRFGRALANMPGMRQKRSNLGKLYFVKQRC